MQLSVSKLVGKYPQTQLRVKMWLELEKNAIQIIKTNAFLSTVKRRFRQFTCLLFPVSFAHLHQRLKWAFLQNYCFCSHQTGNKCSPGVARKSMVNLQSDSQSKMVTLDSDWQIHFRILFQNSYIWIYKALNSQRVRRICC